MKAIGRVIRDADGVMQDRLDSRGNIYEIIKEKDTIPLDIDPSVIDF